MMASLAEVCIRIDLTTTIGTHACMEEGTTQCTVVGIWLIHRAALRTSHTSRHVLRLLRIHVIIALQALFAQPLLLLI